MGLTRRGHQPPPDQSQRENLPVNRLQPESPVLCAAVREYPRRLVCRYGARRYRSEIAVGDAAAGRSFVAERAVRRSDHAQARRCNHRWLSLRRRELRSNDTRCRRDAAAWTGVSEVVGHSDLDVAGVGRAAVARRSEACFRGDAESVRLDPRASAGALEAGALEADALEAEARSE